MTKEKFFSLVIISFLVVSCCQKISTYKGDFVPSEGYVPDAETAVKVAEALWLTVYGNQVLNEKPFTATLKDGVWIVKGTLHSDAGGVAYIELQKSDCRVLKIMHGK